MTNVFNNGTVTGNLASEPKVFNNQNGSSTIFVTVSIKGHSKDGQVKFDNINLRIYTDKPKQIEFIANLQKGRLVTVQYHLNTYNKPTQDGKYHAELQAIIDSIAPLETSRTFNARQNYNAQQAQTNAYQQQQPANNAYQQPQTNNYQQSVQPQAPQVNQYQQQPQQPVNSGYQQQAPQSNGSYDKLADELNKIPNDELPF